MKNFSYLPKALLIVAFAFASVSSAFAQAKPIKFTEETLDNGLHVIYQIDKSAPVVSTILHYRVGSRDENPKMTGFAHFFEHLMFESTDDIPRSSMDKYIQEAGGNLNAHTSFDETVYKFNVPSHQIKLALWIESQRMRKLEVGEIGVETQRGVVLEEKKARTDNAPYGTLFEKMAGNLFKGGNYAWVPIGDEKHIQKATIADFRKFYDNFYQPNNACLVICGDFDLSDTKQYVRDYFGVYKKGPEPKRSTFNMPELTKEYVEVVPDKKARLPLLSIGYRGPKLGDKDYYPISLLTDILAAGQSSRMYKRLVDQDQIALQAQVSPMALQKSGLIFFIGVPTPGKPIDKVRDVIYEEIQKVIKEGVTAQELEKAKNIFEAQFISDKKNTSNKAISLAKYFSYYGNANLINTENQKYASVTAEDIKRVAKKYFGTDKRVVLKYMPSK